MSGARTETSLSVSLPSASSFGVVRSISSLVYEHCRSVASDDDVAARFRMAAQELTENIVKYATSNSASLEIELLSTVPSLSLCVRARNESSEERLRDVDRRLRELVSADDPLMLYERLILESVGTTNASGLGLARLRAEGDLTVEYDIKGRQLTISAYTYLAAEVKGNQYA